MKQFLVALVLLSSFAASAQNRIISIDAFDLGYTGGFAIRNSDARGADYSQTDFRFNVNFAQNLPQYEGLMWRAKAYLNRSSGSIGTFDHLESSIGVAGGLLYNLDASDIKNSAFFAGMIGLERGTYEDFGRDDKSAFNLRFEVEGGKRWDLGRYAVANISYAPTVSFAFTRFGGGIREDYFKSQTELKFNFLKFDILF